MKRVGRGYKQISPQTIVTCTLAAGNPLQAACIHMPTGNAVQKASTAECQQAAGDSRRRRRSAVLHACCTCTARVVHPPQRTLLWYCATQRLYSCSISGQRKASVRELCCTMPSPCSSTAASSALLKRGTEGVPAGVELGGAERAVEHG